MSKPVAPTYRERLRREGAIMAACGLAGSGLLLARAPQARRWPLNTVGQLLVVVLALLGLGPRAGARALATSSAVPRRRLGSGEPTPLWQLPAIVGALALLVAKPAGFVPRSLRRRAGWDAALRVTAGSMLVGAYQAVGLERQVRRAEEATGRTYYRLPGSRLGRGTVLGWTRRGPVRRLLRR